MWEAFIQFSANDVNESFSRGYPAAVLLAAMAKLANTVPYQTDHDPLVTVRDSNGNHRLSIKVSEWRK